MIKKLFRDDIVTALFFLTISMAGIVGYALNIAKIFSGSYVSYGDYVILVFRILCALVLWPVAGIIGYF